ncbi:MAG: alanine racemase [Deltaproteobacteria bacterium]|nr:alanine racemase [Deltaproteobacteria bacterium]
MRAGTLPAVGSAGREARIDHRALRANAAELVRRAEGRTIFAVLKADAYGHGAVPVAGTLVAAGCERLAVMTPGEASILRDGGVGAPILVLEGAGEEAAGELAGRDCAAVVHHPGQVEALARAARGGPVAVHIEIDTGMHRMGAKPEMADGLLRSAIETPGVEIEGLMTHLAHADEPDLAPTFEQLSRFREFVKRARAAGAAPRFVHFANSAALLCGPALAEACPEANAVRPGLALYGARPAPHLPGELSPVMSLVGRVASLRTVDPGAGVGYSATWRAARATRVATVGLGYADGIPVAASNRGAVQIRGQHHPMVGRVSMDSVGVEVGDAPVVVGDEAQAFGDGIPVEEAAAAASTIAYELLVGVGGRVPRIHVGV